MSAILLLLSIVVVCIVLQAPLEAHANADKTPNPSKAPWYFLNLQELLLHMHPSLAGVLIPAGVLFGAIPLIPYFDRNTADVGKWFGTAKAVPICIFTSVYSTDHPDRAGAVRRAHRRQADDAGARQRTGNAPFFADTNPFGIGALEHAERDRADDLDERADPGLADSGPRDLPPVGIRDYMFALFTGFVVSYVVLTIVGSFFRGEQMILMWPWDPRQARLD